MPKTFEQLNQCVYFEISDGDRVCGYRDPEEGRFRTPGGVDGRTAESERQICKEGEGEGEGDCDEYLPFGQGLIEVNRDQSE